MSFSTENERFFALQGGRGKIAAGIAKAISRTILSRQHSRAEKEPFECKGILLDAQRASDGQKGQTIALKGHSGISALFFTDNRLICRLQTLPPETSGYDTGRLYLRFYKSQPKNTPKS